MVGGLPAPPLPFIRQTLKKYPTLPASRLYEMVCGRGYRGSQSHFRRVIASLRPKPEAEAYLRLKTLPGEQAQVDWAHFGKVRIGRAERPLMGFVMVLSYSRRIFLRFYLGERAVTPWSRPPRERGGRVEPTGLLLPQSFPASPIRFSTV